MFEGQTITIIISSVCALVGGAVLLVRLRKEWNLLKISGLAFLVSGLLSLFFNDADFRQILTAAAGVTAAVAATFALQQNTQLRKDAKEREERDRKEILLKEVREWVFEIRNITLEPITEDNMAFMQVNISLQYGRAFNRVEYFGKAVLKIFKDEDFDMKLNKVAELLIAIMVLGNVVYSRKKLDVQDFKAFVGYKDLRDSLLSEYENMLAEVRKKNKDGIESRLIDLTNNSIKDKYVIGLNNSESALLSKLTDIESSLL